MIVNGNFTSVWADEGEIETSCKVNTDTHEVFNIERVDPADYGKEWWKLCLITKNLKRRCLKEDMKYIRMESILQLFLIIITRDTVKDFC